MIILIHRYPKLNHCTRANNNINCKIALDLPLVLDNGK